MPHFTPEQEKQMNNIEKCFFNKSVIQDFSSHGIENVESEDFDPGYGCVPVMVPRVIPLPPQMIQPQLTAAEKWNLWYENLSEKEKEEMQDRYLSTYGI